MKDLFRVIVPCLLLILSSAVSSYSQNRTEQKLHDPLKKIDRAYESGEITLDQKVLYKFYAAYQDTKIPESFRSSSTEPLKCGTPATSDFHRNKEQLSAATQQQIQSFIDDQTLQASETYQSASGNFTIYYETSGEHAVPPEDLNNNGIPDYVEEVAAAADSSYRHEVFRLGYADPIPSGQTYPIEVRNLQNFYGQTIPTGMGTTYIQIENDFSEGFPPNDDPAGQQIGAIKVTVAHEFKHAVQYQANQWQGETGNWLEMDATLMEEVVYDNVNDYYNYLMSDKSIFKNPSQSFYPGSYYHVSWALYFEERYDSQFLVDVWQVIQNNPAITMIDAITQTLGGPEIYNRAYLESQLWHYASGNNTAQGFGFEESEYYPTPPSSSSGDLFTKNFQIPRESSSLSTANALAADYYEVPLNSDLAGSLSLEATSSANNNGLGLIAYLNNGSAETLLHPFTGSKTAVETSSLKWNNIHRLGLVLANSSPSSSGEVPVFLALGSNSFENTLSHNYPNPFNQSTKIRFTLEEKAQTQLRVYDSAGRLVKTLINEELTPGLYEPTFEAQELASGVYFYQLLIDEQQIVKKMTLIK